MYGVAYRYQYLNFVDFLAKNKYMLSYGNGPAPSLNDEHEFNNWDRFFAEGSQRLERVRGSAGMLGV